MSHPHLQVQVQDARYPSPAQIGGVFSAGQLSPNCQTAHCGSSSPEMDALEARGQWRFDVILDELQECNIARRIYR
jgi:hypothetical protein